MSKNSKPDQQLIELIQSLQALNKLNRQSIEKTIKSHPKKQGGYYSRSEILKAWNTLSASNQIDPIIPTLKSMLKLKPIRTASGVTPVTVLTKPYPCPGKCIFCPNDVRMPKSYISSEPGAQRAEKNYFDPYLQTYNRLKAYKDIGHPFDKVELIVLGGTWSFYPEPYQIWFIKSCFEALNDFGFGHDQSKGINPSIDVADVSQKQFDNAYNQSITKIYQDQEASKAKSAETATWDQLYKQHQINQSGKVRCVGLVLETRPDSINQDEVIRLRRLGCTKVQIGLQSLQDSVLKKNKRGHDVTASRRAMKLLRNVGFKIHAHWMPNLYGSSLNKDIDDYRKLFSDPDFKPDELKIYPCSLIDDTPLVEKYKSGHWQPYNHQELLEVITTTMAMTPEYCRLTRIIRDIPSDEILEGNKFTNFRQLAEVEAKNREQAINDIRSREIRSRDVSDEKLTLKTLCYNTSTSIEYFLQFVTPNNQIAGFLRLSLPNSDSFISELKGSAIIREVHVYGSAVNIGTSKTGAAQHIGLGKRLIGQAESVAKSEGFKRISVISAVGTREYYQNLGYQINEFYQHKSLT